MYHLQRLGTQICSRMNANVFKTKSILKVVVRCRHSVHVGPKRPLLHHEWIIDGKISKSASSANSRGVVLFLHGLLGSGKNLRTLAKKFTAQTGMSALLLDLRGHGQSNDANRLGQQREPPHSIANCSMDVIHTAMALDLVGENSPVGIVGHSFGGRTALSYHHSTLLRQRDTSMNKDTDTAAPMVHPPQQCWILDSCPGRAHSSVAGVIDAVSSIPMPISSKKELVDTLVEQNISKAIASWMTTNLQPCTDKDKNGFEFMFDLHVAKGILADFPKHDMFQQLRDCITHDMEHVVIDDGDRLTVVGSNRRVIHKVIAKKNGSWSKEIVQELQDIQDMTKNKEYQIKGSSGGTDGYDLNILTLDAGHWVHIDALDSLIAAMVKEFT